MNSLMRLVSKWGRLPLLTVVVVGVVVGGGFLVAADGTEGQDASPPVLALVLIGLVLVAVTIVIGRLGILLAGVDPDADLIAQGLLSVDEQQRLLSRWLQRTRWARNVGGIAGVVWWLLGTSAQGDLLLFGIGGLALGSIAAQLHHVRPARGLRTASLERRSISRYLTAGWHRRMIAVAVGATALGATGLAVGRTSAAIFAFVAVAVLAVTHLVQRRVATRPRAALSVPLQFADDLARELAIDRGLAEPSTYFALVLIAHSALDLEPAIGGAATAIAIGAWLYALYSWWGNRRLGLDFVMAQPPAPVTSSAA